MRQTVATWATVPPPPPQNRASLLAPSPGSTPKAGGTGSVFPKPADSGRDGLVPCARPSTFAMRIATSGFATPMTPNWMPKQAGPDASLVQAWLERLPSHTVTQTESLFDVFAQEDVPAGDQVRVLPRGHKFKHECIGNLFTEMPRSHCPECRRDYSQVSSSSCLTLGHNSPLSQDIDPARPAREHPAPAQQTPVVQAAEPTAPVPPPPTAHSDATSSVATGAEPSAPASPASNAQTIVDTSIYQPTPQSTQSPSQQTHTGDPQWTESWGQQYQQASLLQTRVVTVLLYVACYNK